MGFFFFEKYQLSPKHIGLSCFFFVFFLLASVFLQLSPAILSNHIQELLVVGVLSILQPVYSVVDLIADTGSFLIVEDV